MPILDDLRNDLNEITTLKFISAAFAESASSKISKIRSAFEQNAQYYDEVGKLYHIIRVSAGVAQKLGQKDTRSEKTLSVAITSNHRFYGLLNVNTMEAFISESESDTTDRMVIGQTGIDFLTISRYAKQYSPVVLKSDYPTKEENTVVLTAFKPYTRVILYYPKFMNMLKQSVEKVDITETPAVTEVSNAEMVREIFEPNLSMMLDFFDTQIRAVLFQRAMLEAQLSREAARLLAMSAAEERADKLTKEKRAQIGKVKSTILNTQLMETFTGRSLWKKS